MGQVAKELGSYGKHITHGVAQGVVSVLQGGKFKSGFIGGFVGHAAKGLGARLGFDTRSFGDRVGRTMVASIAGGTISQWSGGKFANGAVSAAFTHLFNAEAAQKIKKLFVGNLRVATNGMTRNSLSFIGGRRILVEGAANAAFGLDGFYYRVNHYEYNRGGHMIGHAYPTNIFGQRDTVSDLFTVQSLNFGAGVTGYSQEHYAPYVSPGYVQESFVRWDIRIPPQMMSNENSSSYELNVYQIID